MPDDSKPAAKRKSKHRLGDLQLSILRILWKYGWSSVSDVRQRLEGDALAYTTVATMLRKMDTRELVRHREDGRRFLYQAAVSADEVSRSMSSNLVDRLFEGSLADAVHHLLETRDVDQQELERLERLIKQRKKQL